MRPLERQGRAGPRPGPSRIPLILILALGAGVLSGGSALASRAEREEASPALVLDQVERKVAIGVSTPWGYNVTKLKRFTRRLGGYKPATWTIWSRWGDPATKAFPSEVAEKVGAFGVTPMIWWEPFKPGMAHKPWFPRFANTIAGHHDGYIRRFARKAKAYGRTILLRYAPETNGAYHPWAEGHFDNTAETFIGAWRHVWDIFRQEGAANVKFVWSVAKQTCRGGCNPYTQYYPGDEYVDYVAFSSFNWGAMKGEWKTMLEGYERVTQHLDDISTRPVMAIETASNGEGGDKAAWFREGYPAVYSALPAVMAIVYLNADLRYLGHPDWRIGSPPPAFTAYQEIAAMPEFSLRFRKRTGGSIAEALATASRSR